MTVKQVVRNTIKLHKTRQVRPIRSIVDDLIQGALLLGVERGRERERESETTDVWETRPVASNGKFTCPWRTVSMCKTDLSFKNELVIAYN